MTIIFSEDEKEWIDKTPFKWTIKKGCPENIRKSLKRKLDALYKNKEERE